MRGTIHPVQPRIVAWVVSMRSPAIGDADVGLAGAAIDVASRAGVLAILVQLTRERYTRPCSPSWTPALRPSR